MRNGGRADAERPMRTSALARARHAMLVVALALALTAGGAGAFSGGRLAPRAPAARRAAHALLHGTPSVPRVPRDRRPGGARRSMLSDGAER